jgi:hypothetical protein
VTSLSPRHECLGDTLVTLVDSSGSVSVTSQLPVFVLI